ncbi:MAG TPA: hypothetical protein VKF35_25925 [Hyphomicrobiaceae bacterium]|nr:hypothetical protein [Hyphomicrobiaceae bacterium]
MSSAIGRAAMFSMPVSVLDQTVGELIKINRKRLIVGAQYALLLQVSQRAVMLCHPQIVVSNFR